MTTLRDIVISPTDRKVGDITRREVVAVDATHDQELAARSLRASGFLALPILGPDGRLVGATHDLPKRDPAHGATAAELAEAGLLRLRGRAR